MNTASFTNNLIALWAIGYLGIAYLIIRRRGLQETVVRYLVIYAIVGFVADLITTMIYQDWPMMEDRFMWVPAYSSTLLLWLFLALSDEFLNKQSNSMWLGFGGIWMGILLVLWASYESPDSPLNTISWYNTLIVFTWTSCLVFALRIAFMTLVAFHQSRQPLYKNRIVYWALALAFISLGDILIIFELTWAGTGLRMVGGLVTTYAIWSYHQANLLQVGLRLASFLTLAFLGITSYAVGSLAFQYMLGEGYNPFIVGMAMAVVLVLLANPVTTIVTQWMHHLVFGVGYDPGLVVREYSQGINNIVDVKLLSQTSLELIAKTFDVKRGTFFLIDQENDSNRTYYWLRPVANIEGRERTSGRLQDTNPLVVNIIQQHQPLMQYDLDVLPEFKEMVSQEQRWLANLNMDVHIPICAPEKWLGLLSLGPKPANSQYSSQDLMLLATLAEQTVVALKNARLFADLEEANSNLKNAYRQLERANQDLKEIDELKSSFIGVISHEMRTPLANVGFSLQIFERHGIESLLPEQYEQFQELKASFQLASMMIENLVMMASFLNNQITLQLEQIDVRQLLQTILPPLTTSAQQKNIQMQLDVIGELPPLLADRKLLSNAIYQLAHNAIKFSNKGGKIWVTCWATSHTICIDVKDNGKGIPSDRLTEMWQEFTQMVDPLKRGLEGLGLGLALVRHIIAAHGGEVWAESEENEGSAFGFQIPIAGPKHTKPPKEIFRKRLAIERE